MKESRHRKSWVENLVHLRLTLPDGPRRRRIKILLLAISYGASLSNLRSTLIAMISADEEETLYRPRPNPVRLIK